VDALKFVPMLAATVLGYRRDGSPIYPIAGGDGSTATVEQLRTERAAVMAEGEKFASVLEGGGILDQEQRKALTEAVTRKRQLDQEIAAAEGDVDALADIKATREREKQESDERKRNARPAIYGDPKPDEAASGFTLGERLVESEQFAALRAKFPRGVPADATFQSDAILETEFRHELNLFTATERLRRRAGLPVSEGAAKRMRAATLINISTGDPGVGQLLVPQQLGLVEPGETRPLTLRDLVTVLPTTNGDGVEYFRETTRGVENLATYVSGAEVVAEATALSGTSGTKPGGALEFEKLTAKIVTIAEWVALTRRAIADLPFLRAYVDQFLIDDVGLALEAEMLNGDATGDHFDGFLNDPDIISISAADYDNQFDALLAAAAYCQIAGNTARPISAVGSPWDVAAMRTLKFGSGATTYGYVGGGPYAVQQDAPWGNRLVPTLAMSAGTVLVGDFSRATLLDREDTNISVGTINDDFIRNIVRVLAEGRWGFYVQRPQAFVKITDFSPTTTFPIPAP
jgi:HK97 family phage major capsid protein